MPLRLANSANDNPSRRLSSSKLRSRSVNRRERPAQDGEILASRHDALRTQFLHGVRPPGNRHRGLELGARALSALLIDRCVDGGAIEECARILDQVRVLDRSELRKRLLGQIMRIRRTGAESDTQKAAQLASV
jgi:hypothetical protein